MVLLAVCARSRSRRRTRRPRRLPLPKRRLFRARRPMGHRMHPASTSPWWRHRPGDPTTRTLSTLRPQPRVHTGQSVPSSNRQRRDRLGRPGSRSTRARTPADRPPARSASQHRPGLAAPCPSERRDHREPGEHHPDRRGPLRSGVTSAFRHPAGNDGPHGWRRNRSLETSVLVPDADIGAGLHATPGRVGAHRRLVVDRQRAGLSPVLAPWLNSPRVCFGAPGNISTTPNMRTHNPKVGPHRRVSNPSSFVPAVNTARSSRRVRVSMDDR